MPLANLLFIFTKKQNTIYSVFLDSWKSIRDLKDISKNLERMYECLAYEQSRQIDSKCIDYFISNELSFSILKLAELSHKSENKDYLGIALIYAERLVVYEMYLNELFVDFITKYVFDDDIFGEYSRASLIYLFSHKDIFACLERTGFIYTFVDTLNLLYKDINKNITFYAVLIEFLSLYVNKDKEGNRCKKIRVSEIEGAKQEIANDRSHCDFLQLIISSHNPKELSNKNPTNIVSLHDNLSCLMHYFEDKDNRSDYSGKVYHHSNLSRANLAPRSEMVIDKERVLENLDLSYRHENQLDIYAKILKANMLEVITNNIIEEFITYFNGDTKSISFLRFLMNSHSRFIGKYFINGRETEWDPFDVYRKIYGNIRDIRPVEFDANEIKSPEKINVLSKILDFKVNDGEIYIFLLMISRSTFFNNFNEIFDIMKDHKTFFGSVYRILMQ